MNTLETASDLQAKAFNPYSYSLNGNRVEGARRCYTNLQSMVFERRGVQCWRVSRQHFAYVKDGIVIAERAGYGESFVDRFLDGCADAARRFHDYERPNEAYKTGLSVLANA